MSRSLGKRTATIDVLMKGCHAAPHGVVAVHLEQERQHLEKADAVSSPRRELLQVVHTSRLLDTFLANFLQHHAVVHPKPPAMGSYLKGLRDQTRPHLASLPEHRRQLHQKNVVNVRNVFLHQAGTFPSKKQADELLSSMHVCLVDVVALE